MADFAGVQLVAAIEVGGVARFEEIAPIARWSVPAVLDVAMIWATQNAAPGIGGVPAEFGLPEAGGTRLALMNLHAHSAGNINAADGLAQHDASAIGADPAMHRTDTVDFEVVISGKVDIVLPGAQRRTLEPGSCLVIGGAMHAWENRYDEPCLVAAFLVGTMPDQ